jgi:hypothetical protein
MKEVISLEKLLNDEPSRPGLVELYQRTMLHRTNEAMNGLSHRLDKIIVQAERNSTQAEKASVAQGKQQLAMIGLTFAIAFATVIYTITTIYATVATASASKPTATSAIAETPALHIGTDENGKPALCIDGGAFEIPRPGDATVRGRFQASRPGQPVAHLKCPN